MQAAPNAALAADEDEYDREFKLKLVRSNLLTFTVPLQDRGLDAKKTRTLYVLQLQDNCKYVGVTNDVQRRLKEHLCEGGGKGAAWTTKHRPLEGDKAIAFEVPWLREALSGTAEVFATTKLALIFGANKVRGAHFCGVEPTHREIEDFARITATIHNLDYAKVEVKFLSAFRPPRTKFRRPRLIFDENEESTEAGSIAEAALST